MTDETEQFVQQLAEQIRRFDLENERLLRIQGMFAIGVVKLERYAQAMVAEVEQLKSQMAGVTPYGLEPTPPTA